MGSITWLTCGNALTQNERLERIIPYGEQQNAEGRRWSVLDRAEQRVFGDCRTDELDPAQRDAIAFPIRLLRLANNGSSDGEIQSFSELAKLVGQTKSTYNDQQ